MKNLFVAAILMAASASLPTAQAQNVPVQFATLRTPTLTAQAVLEKHIEALGGTEKLSALKTVIVKQTTSAQNQEIPQTLYILPGKGIRSEMNAMGTQIIVVARADSGWQVNPPLYGNGQAVALSARQAKSASSQADLFGPLVSAQAKGHTVTYDGDEKMEGDLCHKLTVATLTGGQYTAYIAQKNYMLVKLITKSSEIYYADYRRVDGYWFPYTVEVISGGNKASLIDRSFEVNKPADEALFRMPTGK